MQKHGTVVNCDVVHLYSRNHKNFILQDHYTLLDKCGIRQDRVSCDARLSHSLHTFSAPLNWVSQRALSFPKTNPASRQLLQIQKYENTNSMAYWPEIPPLYPSGGAQKMSRDDMTS